MTRTQQQRTEQGALAADAPWYDYDAQRWMRGDKPVPCGHPQSMKPGCCAAGSVTS